MKPTASLVMLCALFLVGCHTAKKVGVTTFHVLDAPANYIRHQIDDNEHTTTTTTRTVSDVTNPGQPVPVTSAPPRRTASQSRSVTSQPSTTGTTPPRRSSSPAPHTAQQGQSFPTAKPVPGKPGFVISPYDPNGGYVDVTGYPSGSKAKDPYSQKIFIVP